MTKLGLNLRNFGPAASPEHFLAWARFAEDNGFALAAMSDHVAVTPEVAAVYPEPFYESFATLAWLAGNTSRLEFVTSVAILPLRNPVLTARMAWNLNHLSGGRFVLGVGVGWSREEYAAVGVPFGERGRILDDNLATVISEWGTTPARLWVGGASPSAIRRAAQFGDAWHPINVQPDWVRSTGLPALRAAAESLGRPLPAFVPRIRARLQPTDADEADRPVGVGSLGQVLADIEALAELGAEYVVLDTNADRPEDQLPLEHDWSTLTTIAKAYSG